MNEALTAKPASPPKKPSRFYQARLWNFALKLAGVLPRRALELLCLSAAQLYYYTAPKRRAIVTHNLLPVTHGDRKKAQRAAHKLFLQFGLKLADLWRYESKCPIPVCQFDPNDWNVFASAQARGHGVLLITPHLGNWELGAPLLASRGVKLLVLTQAEPDNELTELRRASRARWGIETLVVGTDAFAFVEVFKRLQDGATIALLLDRPQPQTAATVEFFGRPFLASIAAAELARATGCSTLGVYIVRDSNHHAVRILPEFTYDRKELGTRAAREQFTQSIMRAFAPVIEQNIDQWFHFVPIWPEEKDGRL